MAHEIFGKVIQLLPEQTGTGKNGKWLRQDFVIETEEQFPRKVCFAAWGDKVSQLKALQTDAKVKVSFNIESREFNGKWYTDLKIWKVELAEQDTEATSEKKYASDAGTDLEPLSTSDPDGEVENDLPF
jgi:hypothetical protein